jgi:acetylornithine deacetylase
MNNDLSIIHSRIIVLLEDLIRVPSFSKEEEGTRNVLKGFLDQHSIQCNTHLNNVWACNKYFDPAKPSILLNSHHDTVKPNPQYSRDPFLPGVEDGKLFGLGSNDAGGPLVALIGCFLHFYGQPDLKYNLVLAATAEEEISGKNGIEALLVDSAFSAKLNDRIAFGIVGEPTLMQMAVAERGLMVLDCVAKGKAGHAARNEGENAIYKAMKDIEWFSNHQFERISPLLGPCKMNVTSIETENKAHNMVPAECRFVVDTRINELYDFDEVISIIRSNVKSEVLPRSTRLRSTSIGLDNPLVKAGLALGRVTYGSPTTSDKALMPFPALKIGPGDSARSHSADEFIYIHEIREGIELYVKMLEQIV